MTSGILSLESLGTEYQAVFADWCDQPVHPAEYWNAALRCPVVLRKFEQAGITSSMWPCGNITPVEVGLAPYFAPRVRRSIWESQEGKWQVLMQRSEFTKPIGA